MRQEEKVAAAVANLHTAARVEAEAEAELKAARKKLEAAKARSIAAREEVVRVIQATGRKRVLYDGKLYSLQNSGLVVEDSDILLC